MHKLTSLLVAVAIFFVPFISYAALSDLQIDSVTSLVRAFGADESTVIKVQETLGGSVLGATVSCPKLTLALQRGSSDKTTSGQVSELQKFLASYYGLSFEETVTGYFGPVTLRSVIRFQTEQKISAIGIVGPQTRAKIASLCGGTPTVESVLPIKPGPVCPAIAYIPAPCSGSLSPRYDANGCQNGWSCTPIATTTVGMLSAGLDSSSPGVQLVPGGTQNVVIGAFKFSAFEESVVLNKISFAIDDYNFSPADLQAVTLWDGATNVGSAFFTPASILPMGYVSTVMLSQPMLLPQNSGKVLTVKANISDIGTGQPGTSGHKVQIMPYHLFGTGVNSGAAIEKNYRYTGGAPVSYPTWLFKSYPKVELLSLPGVGALDGKLIRFSVSADPRGSIGLAKVTFTVEPTGLTVGAPKVYAYSDASFSIPISGFDSDGGITTGAGGPAYAMAPQNPIQIPAGQSRYFEIRAPISGTGSVLTTVLGDSTFSEMQTASQPGSSFVWSPNSTTVSNFTTVDWTNGHLVPGVLSWGLRASRTNYPVPMPPSIVSFTASPTTITAGQSSTLSWSTTGTTDGGCHIYLGSTGTNVNTAGLSGSGSLTVSPSVTTTYRLYCTNSWKDGSPSTEKTLTVTVQSVITPKPLACPLVIYTPIVCTGTVIPSYDVNGCLTGIACSAPVDSGVVLPKSTNEVQVQ